MQLKSNIKCINKLSFTSTKHIKHCIELVSLFTISRRNWKLRKKNHQTKPKKLSLQGWGYIYLYSFEWIVKSESIAISNEASKYYMNLIQTEGLEMELQRFFKWIGANNTIMVDLGR